MRGGNRCWWGTFSFVIAFLGTGLSAGADPGQITRGAARFTVVAPECIRLEYQADGKFIDAPSLFAVNRAARDLDAKISSTPAGVEIDTGRIHLIYRPNGQPFNWSNLSAQITDGTTTVSWVPGQANPGNLGGTLGSLDYVPAPKSLGEGLLSRDGWYLLNDSSSSLVAPTSTGAPGTVDGFGNGWIKDRPAGSGTDWYLFGYGHDYAAGLRALTTVGGAIPLPRKYVFGSWYSRWWKYTSADYRQLVQEYHDHDFPLDVLVWDMYWHGDGWTGYSWNRSLLPDAEKLLQEIRGQNIHVTLNDHPSSSIQPSETMYGDFMRAMGQDPATHAVVPYDAGNRRFMDNVFQYANGAREHDGVDFWWLDWAGDEHAHFNVLPWLNEFYYRHSEQGSQRGQSFARWAGWGDHRHPVHFSGDTYADWWMLQYQVPFTSTAGNVGAVYWSHDIGGFMPISGGNYGTESAELYTRWTQFGALSPILRMHSTEDPNFDKRPWKWGAEAEANAHAAFHLRAELVPYLYSAAWEAHRDSTPLVRPLYLDSPREDEAYKNSQEYELGDAFLVAPVTHEGTGLGHVASEAMWFPSTSARWYRWGTDESYAGGTQALVSSDLAELPLFARGGMPILMQPYSERPGTDALKTLVVRAYPGEEGKVSTAFLYEDDGLSKDYEMGAHAVTPVTYQRTSAQMSVQVQAAVGSFAGQLAERSVMVEFAATEKAQGAWLNGASVAFEYDPATRINRVQVPAQALSSAALVTIQASESDSAALTQLNLRRRLGEVGTDPLAILAVRGEGVALRGVSGFEVFPGAGQATVTIDDESGSGTRNVLSTTCQAAAGASCGYDLGAPADDGSVPLGVPIVRVAKVTLIGADGSRQSWKHELARVSPKLRSWSWVGPFDYDPAKPLVSQSAVPETEFQLTLDETYKGAGGQSVHWVAAKTAADGAVDLASMIPNADHKLAYAVTFIHSDADQTIQLQVQADDSVEAFLDGVPAFTRDGQHSVDEPVASSPLTLLKAGDHVLLLKIGNDSGGWGFRLGAETAAPITISSQPSRQRY